jgi:hypothetical protein
MTFFASLDSLQYLLAGLLLIGAGCGLALLVVFKGW